MITADDILNEVESLKNGTIKAPDARAVLNRLIKDVRPVHFDKEVNGKINEQLDQIRAKLYVNGDDGSIKANPEISKEEFEKLEKERDILNKKKQRITQKHYKILAIEKLIELAKVKKWGLCKRQGFIYVYNGQYWVPIDHDDIKAFLGEVALKMGVPKFDGKDSDFRRKLFEQFESDAHIPEPEISKDTVLINLQNGTLAISGGKFQLKEFDRADFITYQLPFAYDPDAKAPRFKSFLNDVLPDHESGTVLAEFLGWIFVKNLKLEKSLVLFGTGGNGKSVIFDVITAMLGDQNVTSYPLKNLTDEQGYHRAKLAKTLVNYASEISGNFDSDEFKKLISNEPVQARLPYKDPFILTDYGKFIFNANILPNAGEISRAYFRRFMILNFPIEVPEEKQDKKLADKIISNELPGVLNWVLEGLKRLIEQKNFSRCRSADDMLEQYKRESDTARLFMDEMNYQPDSEKYIFLKKLYSEYKEFCKDDGYHSLGNRNFSRRLKSIGFTIERKSAGNVVYAKNTQGDVPDVF